MPPEKARPSAMEEMTRVGLAWMSAYFEAVERNKEVAADDKFIFPVTVGDVNRDDPALPPEFRAAQWTPFTNGTLGDAFFDEINRSIRRKVQGARR